jgi:hypothetical protein
MKCYVKLRKWQSVFPSFELCIINDLYCSNWSNKEIICLTWLEESQYLGKSEYWLEDIEFKNPRDLNKIRRQYLIKDIIE